MSMGYREMVSLRQFREEEAERERLEREEQERPIREITNGLIETHRKIYDQQKEAIQNLPDPEGAYIDPATQGFVMTVAEADTFNQAEARKYLDSHPDYYRCPENKTALEHYCELNGLKLLSASMLERAVDRLRHFGLLQERPEPEWQPEPVIEQPMTPAEPELIDGWDLQTGEPKQWTQRALDRLSGDDYRRALHLYKADLALPNRPLF